MEQEKLFFDSFEEVLDDLIAGLGGYKRVAGRLWPALSQPSAYARIKACLNPEKPEKFGTDELLWILAQAREHGAHTGIEWLCDRLGYSRPTPIEPVDQQAEVARQLDASLERLEQLIERARELREPSPGYVVTELRRAK